MATFPFKPLIAPISISEFEKARSGRGGLRAEDSFNECRVEIFFSFDNLAVAYDEQEMVRVLVFLPVREKEVALGFHRDAIFLCRRRQNFQMSPGRRAHEL